MTCRLTPMMLALIAAGVAAGTPIPVQAQDATASPPTASASAQDQTISPIGDWLGVLSVQGIELRLAIHLSVDENGDLIGTMDSLDQGANGIPIETVSFDTESQKLTLEMPPLGARYEGTIDAEGILRGTWTQGAEMVLDFERTEGSTALNRPQHPVAPFPYLVQDVRFDGLAIADADGTSQAAEHTLAGTLTLPEGDGPFPAAVLITGSGPQDRDETIFGHRPFLVIADDLTQRGIAVLRYDDRGFGESTGDFNGATHEDFADDARAAVAFLRSDPRIDPNGIGLIGHSEGGIAAPLVAADDEAIAFVVLLAGPGVPMDELLLTQHRALIAAEMDEDDPRFQQTLDDQRALFDVVLSIHAESDLPQAREIMRSVIDGMIERATAEELAEAGNINPDQSIDVMLSPWYRTLIQYEPAVALQAMTCPVLAINGDLDIQVDAADNIAAIENALSASRNPDFTTTILPGLNHLFQPAETGTIDEYGKIETTFDPAALDLLSAWITDRMLGMD